MTKRTANPNQRILKVRWSSEEWTPQVKIVPAREIISAIRLPIVSGAEPQGFGRRKKRKPLSVLWVHELAPRNGAARERTQSTWR